MSFLNLIKEKALNAQDDLAYSCYQTGKPLIALKDLGEWAWKEFIKRNNFSNEAIFYYINKNDYSAEPSLFKLLEIAVACLGETEIKKRLKELK